MTQNQPNARSENPAIDEPMDHRIVEANNRFGLNLFSYLQQTDPTQNLLISPSSVAIALTMTYNGASGNTQRAMAETLHLQGMRLEDVNRANAALAASLENADPAVTLAIANSLWARHGVVFQPDFLQRNQTFYNAEITTLDFGSPEARSRMNNWVSQRTAGKIPDIVDRIDPDAVLFLINAIYFKGSWTKPFDAGQTCDRPFHLLDGTQTLSPMMQQQGQYRYCETETFQAIRLPYGTQRMSMDIVLPKPHSSLAEFYATLTPDHWNRWTEAFSNRPGSLQLPKFTIQSSQTLNDALVALGMGIALSGNADFSNLSDEPTAISDVRHKTFIEVNEEGTEAAAATAVTMIRTSMPIHPPFQMTIDRPFFFAIQDNQTKMLLFVGSVVEPS